MGPDAAGGGVTGVLLVNVGSPDEPTPQALRRYLDEFLGDPMVVDANRLVWWFVRKLIVLPFRAPKSAELYRSIWTAEGSPLIVHSRRQRSLLQRALGEDFRVAIGMRCGQPSIADGLAELTDAGCAEVVVVSMFPQYSGTTTGTCEKETRRVGAALDARRALHFVPAFYGDAGYVASLAARVRAAGLGDIDHVVLSFHGLPQRYIDAGDPYREQCEVTAAALVEALGLEQGRWSLAFQSRFGREPWLEPDVAELVPALAAPGRRVLIVCPGFAADCLETLEEIEVRLTESFLAAGGAELRVVPCLNDDPTWIAALAEIVHRTVPQPG